MKTELERVKMGLKGELGAAKTSLGAAIRELNEVKKIREEHSSEIMRTAAEIVEGLETELADARAGGSFPLSLHPPLS